MLPNVGGLLRSGVASLCLAAGVLHISAAADHRGMGSHVAFFLVVAAAQSALAAAVFWAGRPGRWLAGASAANLGVAAVWAFSRTTGIAVDGSGVPEAIGFKDAITTLLEIGAVAGAGFWWLLPEASRRVPLESRRLATAMLGTGVWALGASGLFAGHTHSAGHNHEGGHAGAAHAHGTQPTAAGQEAAQHDGAGHDSAGHDSAGHDSAGQDGAGHDGGHAHAPDGTRAAAASAHDHVPVGGAEAAPHDADGHLAAGTPAAGPHDHGASHDHAHPGQPVPSQAARERHDHPAAPSGAGHHHDQTDQGGHDHADGHSHGQGSGGDQRHDAPEPEEDHDDKDDGGSTSPLEDVLKLIQPR